QEHARRGAQQDQQPDGAARCRRRAQVVDECRCVGLCGCRRQIGRCIGVGVVCCHAQRRRGRGARYAGVGGRPPAARAAVAPVDVAGCAAAGDCARLPVLAGARAPRQRARWPRRRRPRADPGIRQVRQGL
ncbi:hypothetical protein LPJ66_012072, partial [Kickxella alabastrina]